MAYYETSMLSSFHAKPLPTIFSIKYTPVADLGFPVGGGVDPLGGCGPPTWALFSENVCENKRIGSHGGGGGSVHRAPGTAPLDPPMHTVKVNVFVVIGATPQNIFLIFFLRLG